MLKVVAQWRLWCGVFSCLTISVVTNALAQIPVGPSGTPTITFDATRILPASEWATTTNGIIPGSSATLSSPDQVDAAVQTVEQSSISMPLLLIGFNRVFQGAEHNTNAGYLVTAPTTVTAVPIKATLRNTSGIVISAITVSYDFGVASTSSTETAFGHRVFFSTTGLSNTWNFIPEFSDLNNAAFVTATLSLTNWLPNTDIYLLWLDDNALTAPDGFYTIGNFRISGVMTTNPGPLVVTNTLAQIPVGLSGTPTITFDGTRILPASEWATMTNGIIPGSSVTLSSPDRVDAAAQTVDQSSINMPLLLIASNRFSQGAQYNTNAAYLVTAPTTVTAVPIKATLRNTSGIAISAITVSYDFGVASTSTTESAFGHRVFFSTTGLSNTWNFIPEFSGLNDAAFVTATLSLTNWLPETEIYLLWVDDNAFTAPDGIYTIDNFRISGVVTANSRPRLNLLRNPETDALTITWTGGGVLQYAADLLNAETTWMDVPEDPNPHIVAPNGTARRFFRLRP